MADPVIRLKRSAVAGKRPTLANLELGEVALNTYDGNLFTRQDTSGVGIGTTVTLLTPWQESYGGQSISYTGDVGITGKLNVLGVTTAQFLSVTGIATISGLTYPSSDGSPNQYLKTDGSGNLSFADISATLGLQTSGGFVGSGVTTFDFRGSGISTITSPSLGFSTIFIENTPNSITRTITNRTAGAGQTTFGSLDYEIGYIDVFLNGVRLSDADYTATDGTTVAISTSLSSGDNLDFIAYDRILDSARWSISSGNNIYNTSLGNVGIASTIPTSKLTVTGDVLVSGVVTATDFDSTSDLTLKDNIRKISKPISKIEKIRGVTFEWKETGQKAMGVVAQEIEKVLPSLVRGDAIKTVNYNGLIGLLIECVKDQQKQIDILNQKINSN